MMATMDGVKLLQAMPLLVIIALTIGGYILFLRWNNRRARRLRAEAEARGETIPSRIGLRITLACLGVVILLAGLGLLQH
jgi:uncharacterized iron-regulated membrane protein